MKRGLLVIGPVVALIGALGLVMYGSTIVGVFDVFTYRAGEPVPASLAELPLAVQSAMAVVIGLVVSCVAAAVPDSKRTISVVGRLSHVAAGLSLIAAAIPVVWVIVQLKASFRIIAMSATAPTVEEIHELIQSAEPKMTIGAAVLLLATGLLALGGLVGFPTKPSAPAGSRAALGVFLAIGSVLTGAISLLLLFSAWSHGNALNAMLADPAASPKAVELAEHLQAILNGTLLAFGGVATQGVLQILAAIVAPSAAAGTDSDS